MKRRPLPSPERLRSLLDYDQCTGVFVHKKSQLIAGTVRTQKGYLTRMISVDGKQYIAARLAWLYVTGDDVGPLEIDHIDGNSLNDAFTNLRVANRNLNCLNRSLRAKTSNLPEGVNVTHPSTRMKSKPYQATICIGGKRQAKYFATAEEAAAWREEMKKQALRQAAVSSASIHTKATQQ